MADHVDPTRMRVVLARHRQARILAGRAGAEPLLAGFPTTDLDLLDEPEEFPDGWAANRLVLDRPSGFRVG